MRSQAPKEGHEVISHSPLTIFCALALCNAPVTARGADEVQGAKSIDIGGGITLHYVEQGNGSPLILIHGSLSDMTYWQGQMEPLAKRYRVIAYSRRYNWPNQNPARSGYSAETDAEDLAKFIAALHLGKVYVIGHSYGALATLFLLTRHPELVKAAVLAEPPLVPLLRDLPPPETSNGRALYDDIQAHMVSPMKFEFGQGRTEAGTSAFIDYVFHDPQGWQKLNAASRADTLKDAHEWDVMMANGNLFPEIPRSKLKAIHVPLLIMSGGQSPQFLNLIGKELAHILPDSESVVFQDSGHQMWMQHPNEARADAEAFFAKHP